MTAEEWMEMLHDDLPISVDPTEMVYIGDIPIGQVKDVTFEDIKKIYTQIRKKKKKWKDEELRIGRSPKECVGWVL